MPLSETHRNWFIDAANSLSEHWFCVQNWWYMNKIWSCVCSTCGRENHANINCRQYSKCYYRRAALWFCCFNVNTENDEPETLLSLPVRWLQVCSHSSGIFSNCSMFSAERKKNERIWQTSFSFHVLCNNFLSVAHVSFPLK